LQRRRDEVSDMADEDEFSIAVGRKYTQDHLWFQLISGPNDDHDEYKIGVSDFIRIEFGKVMKVILPNITDSNDFTMESDDEHAEEEEIISKKEEKEDTGAMGELSTDDNLVGLQCEFDTLNILAPIACSIMSMNGEVENNPQYVNRDAYGDGWFVIIRTHDGFDYDDLLSSDEYVDYLEEL
jgi:glycine cleavage system H lipoate-binding protein